MAISVFDLFKIGIGPSRENLVELWQSVGQASRLVIWYSNTCSAIC